MQAREYSLSFLMDESWVKVPVFSHCFNWKEEEVKALFLDLQNAFKASKEPFLGCFYLLQLPCVIGSKRSLIDGSSRLIILSLLINLLRVNDEYKSMLYNNEGNLKLDLLGPDKKAFKAALMGNPLPNHPISKAYRLLKDLLGFSRNKKEKEEKAAFLHFLIHTKMCVLINLSTQNAASIFTRVNAAAKGLDTPSSIKALIFEKAISLNLDLDFLYEKYWQPCFEKDEANYAFWKNGKSVISSSNEEIFLNSFAIIEGFFSVGKHHSALLDTLYKSHLATLDKEKYLKFLKEISSLAKIRLKLLRLSPNTHYTFKEAEKRLLLILKESKLSSALILVLTLKEKLAGFEENLHKCFYILEIFIITRLIANAPTKDYGRLFAMICKKLRNAQFKECLNIMKKELLQSSVKTRQIPTTQELYKHLGSLKLTQNNLARLLLFFTELYRRDKMHGMQDSSDLSYDFTLEHLLPKECTKYWGDLIAKEGLEAVKKSTQSLGNMTLLKGELNLGLQNKGWHAKLYGDENAKGIKDCADLKITKELFEDEQWSKKWDLNSIREREEELSDDILHIWNTQKALDF